MKEYDFTLTFKLKNPLEAPEIYIDGLYEAGCDDAIIGTGKRGFISLNFIRESLNAYDAVASAIANVKSVINDIHLINISPDLVGVKELSIFFDCSRQNVQKIAEQNEFPTPVYKGFQAVWHLADVLNWLSKNNYDYVKQELLELAELTKHINFAMENKLIDVVE